MKSILKKSFDIYKRNFTKIVIISLLIWIPLAAINAFILNPALDIEYITEIFNKASTADGAELYADEAYAASKTFLIYTGASLLLSIIGIIAKIAFIKFTARSYSKTESEFITVDKSEYTINDCMDESLKKYPKVIWALVLNYLLILCGIMLCFLPGIFITFMSAFTITAVVLSGIKGMNAVRYSIVLTKRKLFATVTSLAVFYMASYFINEVVNLLLDKFTLGTIPDGIISILITCIIEILFAFQTVFFTVLYLETEKTIPEEIKNSFNTSRDTDTNREEGL